MFGGFLLLGGRAGDLFGRRRLFLAGVVIFAAASLLNGLATSAELAVGARALQGLGGALVSPAALSIITTTFAEGEERTKALGVWGAIAAGGGAFGLLLGGILTEPSSWEWIFFVNVPIGIATASLALRYVPESGTRSAHRSSTSPARSPSPRAWSCSSTRSSRRRPTAGARRRRSARTVGRGRCSIAFVFIERSTKAPLIRLGIFRMRSLRSAQPDHAARVGGLFALFFFSSLYVQQILGYSPLEAGLAFLPVTLGIVGGAGIAQQLVKRIGAAPSARSSAC